MVSAEVVQYSPHEVLELSRQSSRRLAALATFLGTHQMPPHAPPT